MSDSSMTDGDKVIHCDLHSLAVVARNQRQFALSVGPVDENSGNSQSGHFIQSFVVIAGGSDQETVDLAG
jgi:hypothetical protein